MYFRKRWPVALGFVLLVLLIATYFYKPYDVNKKPIKEKPSASWRSVYHFTVPDHWMNDPQRPIYFDGHYHFFYLYNKDYPTGNGTAWRHVVSKNLINWHDRGTAIPKFSNGNGDVWSGSIIRDSRNTAGLGKNTLIAILTQRPEGKKQQQYLWYSKDNGITFRPYGKKPVLTNPGVKDFRDPKVIWDNDRKKWVMVLAEGTKIGFYQSMDLKKWQYMSGFETSGIGIVECPDLYLMQADDGTKHWILGASANGKAAGLPNTYAYWTGSFDGAFFHADRLAPHWLDQGFDWYAAVTFEDGQAHDPLKSRYAMAWMNNWDYPTNTPTTKEGFNGLESVPRQLRLSRVGRSYRLLSEPIDQLEKAMHPVVQTSRLEVRGNKMLDTEAVAYQLDVDLSWNKAENAGFRLRESANGKRHIDIGVFAKEHFLYVNRSFTDQPDKSGRYVENRVPLPKNKKTIHLKILVDRTSIEVFADHGKIAISDLVFPRASDNRISLYSLKGQSVFKNLVLRTFQ